MIALLTCKTLQMINIRSRPHHHLERRNHLIARCTHPRAPKQPQIIPLAQHQIRLCVQRVSDLTQPAITAATFQAVFVPEQIERSQQKPIGDALATAGALVLLGGT